MQVNIKVINNRDELITEKNKSGIYSWVNNTNNKRYVGSATNLYTRLSRYYHFNYLNRNKNTSIVKALLKYGYDNFSIEILEYCSKTQLLTREQHWMDKLKPEYNIALIAGSTLGVLHRPETKKLLRSLALDRKVSVETRQKMSTSKLGSNNIWYGKPMSDERKQNLRNVALNRLKDPKPGYSVQITDIETKKVQTFKSMRAAAIYLGTSHNNLKKYNNNVFRNQFLVKIDVS